MSGNRLVSRLLEASPLAELRCFFEGCIDRTAVDARVIQFAIIKLAQREQGGLPFAMGDGRGNPAVEKAPQPRDQEVARFSVWSVSPRIESW